MLSGISTRLIGISVLILFCGSLHGIAIAEGMNDEVTSGINDATIVRTENVTTPSEGSDRILTFENEKVKIWSMTLAPKTPISIGFGKDEAVMLILKGGRFRTLSSDKKATETTRPVGDAIYFHAGKEQSEEVLSEDPVPAYVIELKGEVVPVLANHTGYPLAYPRPGSKKIIENARVVVWNYTYTLGKRTAMHYHDKDAVVIFRYAGSINSTTPNGESTVTADKEGEARFSKADRVHYEELVQGQESVIVVEIK